jgi:Flagellar hook-length control protein FliK
LRQAVPQNNSIQKLLNLVSHVTQLIPDIETTDSTKIPGEIADKSLELKTLSKQLNALIQIPLKANELSAKNIQNFLQQSGINFENQLMTQGVVPTKDLKFDLIQLNQSVSQLLNSSNYTDIAKDPQSIKTLVSGNQLSTLASYLLYGIPPADKSIIINFLTNPAAFNDGTIKEAQTFLFQAIHKLTPSQNHQLRQWIQFLPALAEIRQLIEQSINTINNHQLQALQADADSAFMVLFNLLVAKNPEWIDLFNIKISKEEEKEGEDDHWQVTIQLDMPDLGLVEAKLVLINKQLHAGVTSQLAVTHQLIQEHLSILESALIQSGFDVATISCKQETIKPFTSNQLRHGPLLDDKA